MSSFIVAFIGCAAVMLVPGGVVLALTGRSLSALERVAIAPSVSLGVVFLFAEACWLLGVPLEPHVFLLVVAVSLAGAGWVHMRRRRAGRPVEMPAPERPCRAAYALVGVGFITTLAIWLLGMHGSAVVLPNHDAAHHSFMAARIDRLATIDFDQVLVTTTNSDAHFAAFYPLAAHVAAVLGAGLPGAALADGIVSLMIVATTLAFVPGLFVLVWRVTGDQLVAGVSAAVAPAFALFPFKPLGWGGFALQVGMGVLPGAVVLITDETSRWRRPAAVFLSAVVLVGVVATHTSQSVTLVLLALLIAIERARIARRLAPVVELVRQGLASGAGAVILLLPLVGAVAGGVAERTDINTKPIEPLEFVVGNLVVLHAFLPFRQLALACLIIAAVLISVARGRLHVWLSGAGVIFGLYVLASTTKHDLAQLLTLPWYHEAERISYNLAFFWSVPVGLITALGARQARSSAGARRILAGATVLVVVAVAGHGSTQSYRLVEDLARRHTTVGEAEVAAFKRLGEMARDGETVLTDAGTDGALWMYAFGGPRPLFLLAPPQEVRDEVWRDEYYLLANVDRLDTDPRAAAIVERFNVGYVYVDETGFPGAMRSLSVARLRSAPRLRLVFSEGPAHVFRVLET